MAIMPLTVEAKYKQDDMARQIGHFWTSWHSQRRTKISEWQELRNYIFATDTSTTSNASLPWKNRTTLPKLCQIRDNLFSNYISALFPNDEWLKWEGASQEDNTRDKRRMIEAYMTNKCKMGGFRTEVSKLVLDYIDYGNAFAMPDFERSYREDRMGNIVPKYVGPKIRRISPFDIVFNPLAVDFESAPKIIRSLKTVGELYAMAEDYPDNSYLKSALKRRSDLCARPGTFGFSEEEKHEGFQMDGFGSFFEYLQSDYVEVLEFYGDIFDRKSKTLLRSHRVVIIDRMFVIECDPIPQWFGNAPIYQVGWRKRPDNLWAMGPLDNLVGMQYRIDHLENLKADAMDLAVLPPLLIKGEVDAFVYGPGEEIHIDENGAVEELARNVQWVLSADNAIATLEQRMEMYVGAPREAMGIRTAGEKTAFEVSQLMTAAGRIFQEKVTAFEIEMLEPLLNAMLETAVRNLDTVDTVRVLDNELGAEILEEVTVDDITANGVLRPIGARHFAAQAQMIQNLTGIFNSPIGQMVMPHTSAKRMASVVEDLLGLHRFELFRPNVAIFEQQETQGLIQQATETLDVQQQTPVVG